MLLKLTPETIDTIRQLPIGGLSVDIPPDLYSEYLSNRLKFEDSNRRVMSYYRDAEMQKERGEKSVRINVVNCARCGGTHINLKFISLASPIIANDISFSYWAQCPKANEPVLMTYTEKGAEVEHAR